MNAPFTRFQDSEEKRYKFIDDVLEKVAVIESEVMKYLNEGKKAEDPQGSLFETEPVTHMQVLSPENEEEKAMRKLRESGGSVYADPEAMQRVADMDGADRAGEDDPIGGAIEAMVQEQQHMNGKKRKGKGK